MLYAGTIIGVLFNLWYKKKTLKILAHSGLGCCICVLVRFILTLVIQWARPKLPALAFRGLAGFLIPHLLDNRWCGGFG